MPSWIRPCYSTDTLGVKTGRGWRQARQSVAQRAARAGQCLKLTYFLPVGAGASRMSFTGSTQYVGSRYTQIDD